MTLSILPRPKRQSRRVGRFLLADNMPIVLSGQADAAERTAAAVLADAAAQAGAELPIERHGKLAGLAGPTIQMFLLRRDARLCAELKRLNPPRQLGREGYVLDVTPHRVLAAANSAAGLLYAAQTIVQLIEPSPSRRGKPALPCCRIVDWPDFPYRGFMLDVSRFRVPRHGSLVGLIHRLAACKINVLQLYIEHTFLCRRHPDYSRGVNPLTAEQLGELDELCAKFNIELQANQQSLGHQQHMLSLPQYAHMSEQRPADPPVVWATGRELPKPWSFALNEPRVYELLDDIYAEHLTAVRAKLVNLGCDEAWDMGQGRSRKLVARRGKVAAFVEHVRKIAAVAAKYGKRAMIWDDMMRRNPEVLGMLPADVIPVFWHYSQKPNPDYRRIWANSGREHWVAPGCCSWQSITSQIGRAWKNLHWMTATARRGGATGVLNTEWGDRGNFQTLAVSYASIAIGAELSWNSKPMQSTSDFDRRFARCLFADRTGRMGRLYRLLGQTNHVFAKLPYASPPFTLYWDKFPDGKNLVEFAEPAALAQCEALAGEAMMLARELRADLPPGVPDSLLVELMSAADQTLFACRKARLATRVRKALHRGGKLPAPLKRLVRAFARDWDAQRQEFQRVWMLTNERGQIDFRLKLYDAGRRDLRKLLR